MVVTIFELFCLNKSAATSLFGAFSFMTHWGAAQTSFLNMTSGSVTFGSMLTIRMFLCILKMLLNPPGITSTRVNIASLCGRNGQSSVRVSRIAVPTVPSHSPLSITTMTSPAFPLIFGRRAFFLLFPPQETIAKQTDRTAASLKNCFICLIINELIWKCHCRRPVSSNQKSGTFRQVALHT